MPEDRGEHMAACYRPAPALPRRLRRASSVSPSGHSVKAIITIAETPRSWPKRVGQVAVAPGIEHCERLPQVGARQLKIPKIPLRRPSNAVRHGGFWRRRPALDVAQDDFGDCPVPDRPLRG